VIRAGRRRKRAHSGPARPLHATRWCVDTPVSVHGHATQCNSIHHAQGPLFPRSVRIGSTRPPMAPPRPVSTSLVGLPWKATWCGGCGRSPVARAMRSPTSAPACCSTGFTPVAATRHLPAPAALGRHRGGPGAGRSAGAPCHHLQLAVASYRRRSAIEHNRTRQRATAAEVDAAEHTAAAPSAPLRNGDQ